ncbi:ATP phosphoribosyltransferase regulatory subunit [Anaerocolumna xylanovorans]|uniref:ATP phosphoribosyltransferase regulatory subunit n=1 Tax=Anaerocolumna xylanovorans DSM 12503 TaxID=1121345 RepID=A0A1M7YAV9_9FIRM|nr:ATP phosphoribosyltransferase regulatory subunit [Anaerocolumna xylanovorans]SHO49774.1 ATP phosphoribosyltransferase regulatory subunit [Anaerocolumna xylanovorans DSM 12503]
MNDKLLHTPEGVRDIYNHECERKLKIQSKLHHVMELHGFRDIQTPTFEFFEIFNQERGTVPEKDMYKFVDREGNTLVLRPDMTPSIARCAAKYYKEEELPIRLCYMGSIFINNNSYQGKLKESTQLGAELINDPSVNADAEMLALTIECLLETGLKEFQVEIGEAGFFYGLTKEAGFTEKEEAQLRNLIEEKNMFGVEELLSEKEISAELKKAFLTLTELFGSPECLFEAKSLTKNERALKAIERLEEVYEILTLYGLEKYITFDLGMLSQYNYYTGIIFRAYTYGTGDIIASGGRYDNLVEQFGKTAPAIGIAILADQLMMALMRQKIAIETRTDNTLILYRKEWRETAIRLANRFRSQDMNIELISYENEHPLEEYMEYCKRNSIGGILFFDKENLVEVMNCQTGERNTASLSELLV